MSTPNPRSHETRNLARDVQESTLIQGEQVTVNLHPVKTDEAPPADTRSDSLGLPISDWDPHNLEVHPAVDAQSGSGSSGSLPQRSTVTLPTYVRRPHDEELTHIVEAAGEGRSGMVVLIGSSSTGKTRACWEAVQPLADLGWRLWHPFDPSRAEAALADLENISPHTVIWLNEAQYYLGASGGLGERIAAALHTLLTTPDRTPVLVLGTLWESYARIYTSPPKPGTADQHAQVRMLLEGRQLPVPSGFEESEIETAKKLAEDGDSQLAHALAHTRNGRLAQTLAGAPELLRRYQTASPGAKAVLHTAMDARRLGIGLNLPLGFLDEGSEDYICDDEYDSLEDDWVEHALVETSQPVHGGLSPLRQARPRRHQRRKSAPETRGINYRLADYLEQFGREERVELCPPPSFWRATENHLTDPDDLAKIAKSACERGFLRHTVRLCLMLPPARELTSPIHLMMALSPEVDPNRRGLKWFIEHANPADTNFITILAEELKEAGQHESAVQIASQAIEYLDTADIHGAISLADTLTVLGEVESAAIITTRATPQNDLNDTFTSAALAMSLNEAGESHAAANLAFQASNRLDPSDSVGASFLARAMYKLGEPRFALQVAKKAIHHIDISDAGRASELVSLLHYIGENEDALKLARRASRSADLRNTHQTGLLMDTLARIGEHDSALKLGIHALDATPANSYKAFILLEKIKEIANSTTSSNLDKDPLIIHLRSSEWESLVEEMDRESMDSGSFFELPSPFLPYGRDLDGSPADPWIWDDQEPNR